MLNYAAEVRACAVQYSALQHSTLHSTVFTVQCVQVTVWSPGTHQTLDRLKLAIKCKQKSFVAHPNVQQVGQALRSTCPTLLGV